MEIFHFLFFFWGGVNIFNETADSPALFCGGYNYRAEENSKQDKFSFTQVFLRKIREQRKRRCVMGSEFLVPTVSTYSISGFQN